MNTIKIYLAESGRVADLKKDFPLYQYQFQNKLLNIYVPTSIVAPSFTSQRVDGSLSEYVASTSVKIGMSFIARDGSIKKSKNYYLKYLKTLTYQGVEYALYERKLPKEFTLYAGQGANAPVLAANVVNIQQDTESGTPIVLSITSTQTCALDVMPSLDLDNEEVIEPSELDNINAQINEINEILANKQDKVDEGLETESKSVVGAINENKGRIDENTANISTNTEDIAQNRSDIEYIKENYATGEDFIGQLTLKPMPEDPSSQLTSFVVSQTGRQPKNGDVVIVVSQIDVGTDRIYKYFYTASGWKGYEIPPIESAGNCSLGLIQGTYCTHPNGEEWGNMVVDISGGKIQKIYVRNYSGQGMIDIHTYINMNYKSIADIKDGTTPVGKALQAIADSLGNNIVDTYLTKELGATKQYVRDYAMPREFNDVYFISSNGYEKTAPTTPESGVQFTKETNSVGSFEIFSIERVNTADFELSNKNGYNNNIHISSSVDGNATLRLTTQYKKAGQDWVDLNVELTNTLNFVAGEIQKVVFSSPFTYLEDKVVSITDGDLIRQVLEVVTQSSTPTTYSIYSNEIYPSTFALTSQSYVTADVEGVSSKIVFLGIDGVIEANRVVFEVQDAESFIEYRTNQRVFLTTANLPVVGELDRSLPVAITFGDTTYQVYSFMQGSASPITIGDFMSVSSYNTATGYAFFAKLVFVETSDIVGFVIEPATITASQLTKIIDDTDGIVVGLDSTGTLLQLQLNAEITSALARALKTPMSAPATTKLVAISPSNEQEMITLGSNLVLANGVLSATGTGEGGGIDLSGYVTTENFDKLVNNETQIVPTGANLKIGGGWIKDASTSSRAVVIGNYQTSAGSKSVAVGYYAQAQGQNSIAIGSGGSMPASANVNNAIQMGVGSNGKPNTVQFYDDNIYNHSTHTLTVQNIELNGENLNDLLASAGSAPTVTRLPSGV